MMKKLLLSSAIVTMAITGCATSTTVSTPTSQTKMTMPANTAHQQTLVATYQCDQNAKVMAKYQPSEDRAVLTINAPTWQLNNQEITMRPAVSGSGMRFINDTNPNSLYAWHTKGRDGILSVTIAGKEHMLSCEATAKSM